MQSREKYIINIGLRYFYVSNNEDIETMIEKLRDVQAATINEFIQCANSKTQWIEKEIAFQDLPKYHKYLSQFSTVFARKVTIGDKFVPIGIGKCR